MRHGLVVPLVSAAASLAATPARARDEQGERLAYERDMPVDQGGLTQQFVYALGAVSF